jgi:hypothetical protein
LAEEVEELAKEVADPPPVLVEVSDEDGQVLIDLQKRILELRASLADIVLQYERMKQHCISGISNHSDEIQKTVEGLRDKYNLPEGVSYTFTLPEPGRLASFELNDE